MARSTPMRDTGGDMPLLSVKFTVIGRGPGHESAATSFAYTITGVPWEWEPCPATPGAAIVSREARVCP